MFLLGSISKPITMTAVMTLYDRGEFKLEDKVKKYLPEFTGDGRDEVNVGHAAGSKGCSDKTFGHTGSTGTIAWADPASETICVILTSLPARAVNIHPRDVAAEQIAQGSLTPIH